jgi:hypothetical protein
MFTISKEFFVFYNFTVIFFLFIKRRLFEKINLSSIIPNNFFTLAHQKLGEMFTSDWHSFAAIVNGLIFLNWHYGGILLTCHQD